MPPESPPPRMMPQEGLVRFVILVLSLLPGRGGYGFIPMYSIYLVVEPTHLKNITKSKWESSPNRGENKKILETTTQVCFAMLVFYGQK